jgi:hypothetical protein
MTCKGCHQEVERLTGAGFCFDGICSIMERGYRLALQDVKSHMAEQARAAQRVRPINVDANGEPRAPQSMSKELKIVNAWP